MINSRRQFIKSLGAGTLAMAALPTLSTFVSCTGSDKKTATDERTDDAADLFFKISLAEWSLHKELFSGKLDHLDFPLYTKEKFGIHAVEYVNQFFMDKAENVSYLNELKMRCDDNGIASVLIMCDLEGDLGDTDTAKRKLAVENHYKWVEAAQHLGCHSIRVNAGGVGTAEEVAARATESLHQLSTYAKECDISVLVENHGGYSSNGQWLANIMEAVKLENCGTLPDFGNFCIEYAPIANDNQRPDCLETYDRYQGIAEIIPYNKGISAKSYDFDASGNETTIDYEKMFQIIRAQNFSGYIGIEYEGARLSAEDGIRLTKSLLIKHGKREV